ncbi:MAG: phosphate acyltransferase [Actinobacteria bacterium]|nr:phosphate acyltransferase [Actinomycetota bacterium]
MRNNAVTNDFEEHIINSIQGYERTIVYPDGEDIRLAEAIKIFKNFNSSNTVLLGSKNIIAKNIKESGITNTDKIEIIEPSRSVKFNEYKKLLMNIFRNKQKELTEFQADEMVRNNNYFAALMAKSGDAHCGISGSLSSTEAMMRPLIQIIQYGQKKRFLNGAAMEIIPDCPYGLNGQLLLADVAVIPEPNEEQMLDITLFSYETAKVLFSQEPKIAMLSYSTKGSAESVKIDQIRRVVENVKKINPDIKIDGELQFDAALFPDVAKKKCSDSEVAGYANVLIFPELNSANITLKSIHRLAKAGYYGSIIQGAAIPFNDTTRGCSPIDLVWLSGITLMQLKRKEQEDK